MPAHHASGAALQLLTSAGRLTHVRSSVCLLCRTRAIEWNARASFSTTARRAGALDFFRRKIWGTDMPPGQTDPYARLNPEERERELRRQAELDAKKAPAETATDAAGAYEPATTWDGLEQIGEPDQSAEEEWLRQNQFQGFMAADPLSDPLQLTAALHRAVIEVYTLHQAGQPLTQLAHILPDEHLTTSVHAAPSDDVRGATLVYPADEVREGILRSLRSPEPAVDASLLREEATATSSKMVVDDATSSESTLQAPGDDVNQEKVDVASPPAPSEEVQVIEEDPAVPPHDDAPPPELDINQLEAQVASWGDSWLAIPMNDASIKFAVIKRVMQLSGVRIVDPVIAQIDSVRSLNTHLNRPPAPTKLAQALLDDDRLTSLPNVKVFPRRVTPIDKERAVGRWKVIEKELIARNLPVTGRA